ncbi:hypothetical protein As57867_017574, partial [Aphanomyces stellatus]
ANANRSTYMMNYYLQQVADPIKGVNMKPFPNVTDLTSKNPPCYVNNPLCSASPFGCSRDLLAQVCTVCTAASPNCVVRPTSAAAFPSLPKVPRSAPPSPTKTGGLFAIGGSTPDTTASSGSTTGGNPSSSTATSSAATTQVQIAILSIVLLWA